MKTYTPIVVKSRRNGYNLNTYARTDMLESNKENLNRPINSDETEAAIKSHQTKTSPGSDESSAEFYQNFKEKLTPVFLKEFHKIESYGTFQIHSKKSLSHSCQNQIRTHQEKKAADNIQYH